MTIGSGLLLRFIPELHFLKTSRWSAKMTNAHDSIAQGLKEAIELNRGEEVVVRKRRPLTGNEAVIQEENTAEPAGDHKGHPYN